MLVLAVSAAGCLEEDGPGGCRELASADFRGGIVLDGGCYTIDGFVQVSDGHVEIEAGTTLYFGNNAGLEFSDDGRLTAEGTEDAPIRLLGAQSVRGYWRGLRFDGALLGSTLSWVTISDAGQEGNFYLTGSVGSNEGAILVVGRSNVTIADSTFRGNDHAGINTRSGGDSTLSVTGSVFEDNAQALRLHPEHLGALSDLTIQDNDENGIVVAPASAPAPYRVGSDTTWQAQHAPYIIRHGVQIGADVTIAPGAELRFGSDGGISVRDDGALTADAAGGDPILFLGVVEEAGAWRGLAFDTYRGANRLVNVEVRHGGNYQWEAGRSFSAGNVYVSSDGRLFLEDAVIADSSGYGVGLGANAGLEGCQGVSFSGNASGDVTDGVVDICE